MSQRNITKEQLLLFEKDLQKDEKSEATIEKYLRDVRLFMKYTGNNEVTKEVTISYKQKLISDGYATRSINSMIASINSLFEFLGWAECKVKSIKIQQEIFRPEEKELTKAEYERLCQTAERKSNLQLSLILQTICGTGIRVSELQFFTVEAVRLGVVRVSCKAKTREVFIVSKLQKKLLRYCADCDIKSGCVFVTRVGTPMNRTTIWRAMKSLCLEANVNPSKVFPHNLRHLFDRVFYGIEKDIAKLADILGHSNINTTRIYIISTGIEHRQRMENMRLII